MMELIMGVDIGSTNTKAVAFDRHGNVRSQGSAVTKLSHDQEHPTWTYWDPNDIWNGAKAAIAEAVKNLPAGDAVRALACTCFSADFVPVDQKGDPVYPFKSWHCSRTLPQMKEWIEEYGPDALFYRHGRITEKLVSLFTMRWLTETHPEVAEKTDKILLVSDYVNRKLTGRTVTDYTQAATTGAFDPLACSWREEYLDWSGFSVRQMPDALASGTPVGTVTRQAAAETGLAPGTLVVAGAHDNECGAFGLGMKEETNVYNVCGTWEMVLAAHRQSGLDEKRLRCGVTVARYLVPGMFASIIFGLSASFLEWAKDNFYAKEVCEARRRGSGVWETILDGTAKVPPLSNGILALPFTAGGSGTDRNPLASGTILGIDNYLGKTDVMNAMFEGLGYQTRKFVETAENVCGKQYEKIISVGGPTKNKQLMQIKADVCRKRVEVSDVCEGTALGAAMLAGMGAGIYEGALHAVECVTKQRRYESYLPDRDRAAVYEEGYRKYKRAYAALSSV